MARQLTQADLLDALRTALEQNPGPEDALTTREWAERLGCSVDAATEKIRRLLQAGKMERVTVRRVDMKGTTQPVSGYRIAS